LLSKNGLIHAQQNFFGYVVLVVYDLNNATCPFYSYLETLVLWYIFKVTDVHFKWLDMMIFLRL